MTIDDPMLQFSAELRDAFFTALESLHGRADVTGIDIGRDPKGGTAPVLRIHEPPNAAAIRLAEKLGPLPGQFNDASTRLITAAYRPDPAESLAARSIVKRWTMKLTAFMKPNGRSQPLPPLRPGQSVAGDGLDAGTIGLIVFDALGGAHVLSCAHVLAVTRVNGVATCQAKRVFHPSGFNANRIPVGPVTNCLYDVNGDAAIAAIEAPKPGENREPITYCRTIWSEDERTDVVKETRMPVLGDIVRKSGLATRITQGVIDGIGHYYFATTQPGGFRGFRIAPNGTHPVLSRHGDSGAVWYKPHDAESVGIGLHVGSPIDSTSGFAIACHLKWVLQQFGVSPTPPGSPHQHEVSCGPLPD